MQLPAPEKNRQAMQRKDQRMRNANELYQILLASRGKPRWWSEDPFTVMFQAVLVQNTAWRSVEKTCEAIGDKLTPQTIGAMSLEELELLIRPCGFCKAKARTIQALVLWFGQYDFSARAVEEIPAFRLRRELLSIRGIGAETADVILVYAFYKPSFIIDAYTRRLLSRLGCGFSDDASVRQFFEDTLPKDARVYGWYHWLILEHCISTCKKVPRCSGCPLKDSCRHSLSQEQARPGSGQRKDLP